MAKMSIEWHEEMLRRRESLWKDKQKRLSELIDDQQRSNLENSRYRLQIDRAKREGRDGFDRERFNQGREK